MMRVIDADGHVQEDSSEILEYLPHAYREMALETPRSVGLVPPVVGLFPPLDQVHTSFRHSAASFNRAGRVRAPQWAAGVLLRLPHEVTATTCRHEVDELLENPDLAAADKAAILAGNAERLYGPLPA